MTNMLLTATSPLAEEDEEEEELEKGINKKVDERRNSKIDENEDSAETTLINGDGRPGMEARRRTSLIVVVEWDTWEIIHSSAEIKSANTL